MKKYFNLGGFIGDSNRYAFSFEKKKHICGGCGKKSFSRYIDNSTGDILAEHVGICDHINKCGAHVPPRAYFAEKRAKGETFTYRYIPSVLERVETQIFIPNTGQALKRSYSVEYAAINSPEYIATSQYLAHKTGIPPEKQKDFGFLPLTSRTYLAPNLDTHLEKNFKEVFNANNFALAIVPSDLQGNIKIKNPTTKNKSYKVLSAQSTGNYLYGVNQLPAIDQRKDIILLLVEGEEKAACINYNLAEYGFRAITRGGIHGGAYCPIFDTYRTQFKNVIVWFDYDSGKQAGQKAAQRLNTEHGLNYIQHELYTHACKDINDIFIKYGRAFLLDIVLSEVKRLDMLKPQPIQKPIKKADCIIIEAQKGEYLADILPQNGIDLTAECLDKTLLQADTGTGKSMMTKFFKGRRIIICHTLKLCEQYGKYGAKIFNGNKKDYSSEYEYYATTYKSLPNLMRRIDPSQFFLFKDESHLHTTGASQDFMLTELSKCLDLEKEFKGVCHMTATPLYNFDERLHNLRTIQVCVPRGDLYYRIIEYKKKAATIVEMMKRSIREGRFPIFFLNNKGRELGNIKGLFKELKIAYLNSDTKKDEFFKQLASTGRIDTSAIKGIVTTSIFTTGNDINNALDYDFYVCDACHSVDIKQFVGRARQPRSISLSILKSIERPKRGKDFTVKDCAKIKRSQSERRVEELNTTPLEYRFIAERASLNTYAIIQNGDYFEVNDLLLSNIVYRLEKQNEYSRDEYQEANLKEYGILRLEDERDGSEWDSDEKRTIAEVKAAHKAKKEAEISDGLADLEAAYILAEHEKEVPQLIEMMKQSESEGGRLAASSFEKLTKIGVAPMKVSELVLDKRITNENKLNSLIKSISISQLRESKEYLKTEKTTALQILTFGERIKVGQRYTVSMLRNAMCDTLRIEKDFNKRAFEKQTTSHDVLDFARLFFDIDKDGNGNYKIKNTPFFNDYYIEMKSKKVVCNELIFNRL